MLVPRLKVNEIEINFILCIYFISYCIIEIIYSGNYIRLLNYNIVYYFLVFIGWLKILISHLKFFWISNVAYVLKKLIDIDSKLIHKLGKSLLSFWIWWFAQTPSLRINLWFRASFKTMNLLSFLLRKHDRLSLMLRTTFFGTFCKRSSPKIFILA